MENKGQITRIIVMIVVMINSIFLMNDINLIPFSEEEISIAISSVALVVSELVNHYKNNDYSNEAKRATKNMRKEKEHNKF